MNISPDSDVKTTTANNCLLDTSIWLAILNRTDIRHLVARKAFEKNWKQVFATNAVLTETMYMVRHYKGAGSACLDHVINGAVQLVHLDRPELARVKGLMGKYSDVPMSFADATLVVAGEKLNITTVLTLDRRGFDAYRMYDSSSFNVLP